MKIVGSGESGYSGRDLSDRRASNPTRSLGKLAKSTEMAGPVATT